MKQIHILSYTLSDGWDAAVDGWVTWLTAGGCSPATCRIRRSHIRCIARQLGSTHPREVTTVQLVGILGAPGGSMEHRRGRRNSLASFFRWCQAEGVTGTDPAVALPHVRAGAGAPRPATDEIWQQVLDTADVRVSLMARLAGEAGLRRAEVAQVHTDDLMMDRSGASLIVHGKGNKQRVVPITVSLADQIVKACPLGGFLFPGQIDGHISPNRVGVLVSRVMPPNWSMHKLRHRYATRGYAGTGNLRAVQEALGHTSVATTQRYTAVSSAEIRLVSEAAASKGKW